MTMGLVIAILSSNAIFEFAKFLISRKDSTKGFATKEDLTGIRQGLMAMCQTTLEEKMQFYLTFGEITDTQFKALTTLTEAYATLGGNSFVHTLYEQCKEMYEDNR